MRKIFFCPLLFLVSCGNITHPNSLLKKDTLIVKYETRATQQQEVIDTEKKRYWYFCETIVPDGTSNEAGTFFSTNIYHKNDYTTVYDEDKQEIIVKITSEGKLLKK